MGAPLLDVVLAAPSLIPPIKTLSFPFGQETRQMDVILGTDRHVSL